jgi:sialate O-acetylesterase
MLVLMKKHVIIALLCLLNFSAFAEIRLPNVLSSHMVLQQNATVKLWGWGAPGEKIKVTNSWDLKIVETVADGDAKWQVNFQTPKAGGPYTITFEGKNKIVLDDILIGEVWLCSGQSNMQWSYGNGVPSIKEELAGANKLNIRLLTVPRITAKTPQEDIEATWLACDSNALKTFSAVGYYFGKKLNQDLNVPIGLISSNWGGTAAEVWTPSETIANNETLTKAAAFVARNQWTPSLPGYAYNAMIAPLGSYSIAGAIWYQGEANRETAESYAMLIDTMVNAWRKDWKYDFPFYYVQIAPYRYDRNDVGALLREAQAKNMAIKNSGMVVVSDLVNDTMNIHPTNKKDVGLRLANLALAQTYGTAKVDYKSPTFKSLTLKGNQAIINFNDAENGLTIKGAKAKEVYIAGADQVFYLANVNVKGGKLLVSSQKVKQPVAVRYQFSNTGIGNLFNKAGLPVAPFRTDNWKIDTSKVKPN